MTLDERLKITGGKLNFMLTDEHYYIDDLDYWLEAICRVYGYWATEQQVEHVKKLASEPQDTPKRRKARKVRDLVMKDFAFDRLTR